MTDWASPTDPETTWTSPDAVSPRATMQAAIADKEWSDLSWFANIDFTPWVAATEPETEWTETD